MARTIVYWVDVQGMSVATSTTTFVLARIAATIFVAGVVAIAGALLYAALGIGVTHTGMDDTVPVRIGNFPTASIASVSRIIFIAMALFLALATPVGVAFSGASSASPFGVAIVVAIAIALSSVAFAIDVFSGGFALLVPHKPFDNDVVRRGLELMAAIEHVRIAAWHGVIERAFLLIVGEKRGITWQHVCPRIKSAKATRENLNGHVARKSNVAQIREKSDAMIRLVRPFEEGTKDLVRDIAVGGGQRLPGGDEDVVAFRVEELRVRYEERGGVEQRDVAVLEPHSVHQYVGVAVGVGETIPSNVYLRGAVGASDLGEVPIIKIEVLDRDEGIRHGGGSNAQKRETRRSSLVPVGTYGYVSNR